MILFSLNTLSSQSNTTEDMLSNKEILGLIKQSSSFLHEYKFENSFEISRKALHHAIINKDNYLIARSYNNIAANYQGLAEYDKAIFYFVKGLLYANRTNNDTIKSWLNNNLGNLYGFDKNQFSTGLKYYKKALWHSEKTNDSAQIYVTKLNLAWAYFYIGNFEKGEPYLNFINVQQKKFGSEKTAVALNMLNGVFYSHKNEYNKARSYFVKAIALGNQGKEKQDLSYAYDEYSKLLFKIGDYKKAYENMAAFNKLNNELTDFKKLRKANLEGINLELDEYKRKVNTIETEKELQYQSLKKSRIIVVLFIAALIVLLLLLYTLYKSYRFKQKKNKELTITNKELSVAKENAEVASLQKSQFVSTISHELRTPLYGVVGITNMLLDEHKELANSPHLSSLKFSARYLLSLVNDVLQINKIEENRIVLENMTFNISDEINMIKNSLSFLAKNHDNKINVYIDPAIPEYLIGDKLRLSQILINLVSNALKFTQSGEVKIKVDLVKLEDKECSVKFNIEDNGIGIAKEDQDKIFDTFVQIGRKEIDYQGTGLGLAIVKRLLNLFDSSISLESEAGKGTKFTFVIKFEHDSTKSVEMINNIEVDLGTNQVFKILVVEDNKINQVIIKKIIEKQNSNCIIVNDGFAALEILDKDKFDVILMDINMPIINGFETTRRIREKGINTPVIALTAFNKEEISEEAISAGFDDIINKPFESEALFKSINYLLLRQETLSLN
ncbi:tetratricopeptide repeat-containing hybrid sensor histidine kinase/response regulator [Flavobacterium granuli]|uniref:tetratricopeptide repeat-containing hybrid sensor histidine kinase/response regulator n=1 Tax=Flavobacterium granuli TaxID=280093 RepID=UPI001FCD091A|nr:ATP-binding protein [Flavobacterium granuli]